MTLEDVLIETCRGEHIEVVKLLIKKGVVIHVQDDIAFIYSCINGHIELVKLLINLVGAQNDTAFINSCMMQGYIEIEIVKLLINKLIKQQTDINDVCMICKNNENQLIKLNCSHVICVDCLVEWVKIIKRLICPYCQQKINFDEKN